MRQITIRGIPDQIENVINKEAKREGLSLNKAFIALLARATDMKTKEKKSKTMYHDLDRLSGVWTKEEAADFDKKLAAQRKVDADLWKRTE